MTNRHANVWVRHEGGTKRFGPRGGGINGDVRARPIYSLGSEGGFGYSVRVETYQMFRAEVRLLVAINGANG